MKIFQCNLSFQLVSCPPSEPELVTEPGLILRADTWERSISGLTHHKDPAPMGHLPTALSILDSSHLADEQF